MLGLHRKESPHFSYEIILEICDNDTSTSQSVVGRFCRCNTALRVASRGKNR